jgi:KipI family sensor histidine kinase inhibitor
MWLVECGDTIDPAVNAQAIRLARRVREHQYRGVRDVVPGYGSVGIHFDPLRTDLSAIERDLAEDADRQESTTEPNAGPAIEIAVQYGGEDGPDLEAVAAAACCSASEVVAKHTGRLYRVYMIGFVPGFAYMGSVDPSIAMPRHRVPRERVPAGSVGITGEQTGVYPISTPGGWQLIGRTDAVMFDPTRTPASLLAPGDLVRFVERSGQP